MAGFSFIGSPALLFVGMGVFDIFANAAGVIAAAAVCVLLLVRRWGVRLVVTLIGESVCN